MINNDTNTLSIPMIQMIIFVVLVVTLTACSSPPSSKYKAGKQKITVPEKGEGGGYYLDDGPGANPPTKLDAIPDAVPKVETLRKANMRPYVALGKSYQPMKKFGCLQETGRCILVWSSLSWTSDGFGRILRYVRHDSSPPDLTFA